jgi:hypothetical protein
MHTWFEGLKWRGEGFAAGDLNAVIAGTRNGSTPSTSQAAAGDILDVLQWLCR